MRVTVLYDTSQLHPGEVTGILISRTDLCATINFYQMGEPAVPHYKVDLYANNNRTLRVFVKDDSLNIINLTGAVAVLTVKPTKTGTTTFTKTTAVAAQGIIAAADEGEINFYIVPADTASLDIRQYVFDVKATLSNGKKYTVVEGILDLLRPVG